MQDIPSYKCQRMREIGGHSFPVGPERVPTHNENKYLNCVIINRNFTNIQTPKCRTYIKAIKSQHLQSFWCSFINSTPAFLNTLKCICSVLLKCCFERVKFRK
jgi:hypothetical protein